MFLFALFVRVVRDGRSFGEDRAVMERINRDIDSRNMAKLLRELARLFVDRIALTVVDGFHSVSQCLTEILKILDGGEDGFHTIRVLNDGPAGTDSPIIDAGAIMICPRYNGLC